jgi:hypothetical protein
MQTYTQNTHTQTQILEARLKKEAAALPKFDQDGPWREETATLRDLHRWCGSVCT